MARIRSIHPGLFTDEAFMTASPYARLLIIGIWTEAWDDGVFEWKPLTLKARLFPVDAVNVADLLAELVTLGFVKQFDGGKPYGAIRNFQKYQRPKKPNSSGVLPNDLREYVGVVPNQLPTGSENSPQMEDGGWREGEEEAKDASKPASLEPAKREIFLKGAEHRCIEAAGSTTLGPFLPIAGLLLEGVMSLDRIVSLMRSRPAAAGGVLSWKFYAKVIRDEAAAARPSESQGPAPVFIAKGSPEWDAWQAAEPGKHKAIQMNAGIGCYVSSRFPPDRVAVDDPGTEYGAYAGRAA